MSFVPEQLDGLLDAIFVKASKSRSPQIGGILAFSIGGTTGFKHHQIDVYREFEKGLRSLRFGSAREANDQQKREVNLCSIPVNYSRPSV